MSAAALATAAEAFELPLGELLTCWSAAAASWARLVASALPWAVLAVLHWWRLQMQAGGSSPENEGARPPQERPFSCASCASASSSLAARAGEPSGSPVPSFRSANPALGRHPRLAAWGAVLNRNEGADNMAVHPLGASAPASPNAVQTPAHPRPQRHPLHLVPTMRTRTRCNHGTFMLGGQLAAVYSTRSAGKCYGIRFELGTHTLHVDADMTPGQARSMARALLAAAAAVDQVQASTPATREGGAA